MNNPKQVTLSDTTAVRLDAGVVEVLRSAQEEQQGAKMTLQALAQWRGWEVAKATVQRSYQFLQDVVRL